VANTGQSGPFGSGRSWLTNEGLPQSCFHVLGRREFQPSPYISVATFLSSTAGSPVTTESSVASWNSSPTREEVIYEFHQSFYASGVRTITTNSFSRLTAP
jgi:hypothetical protein